MATLRCERTFGGRSEEAAAAVQLVKELKLKAAGAHHACEPHAPQPEGEGGAEEGGAARGAPRVKCGDVLVIEGASPARRCMHG